MIEFFLCLTFLPQVVVLKIDPTHRRNAMNVVISGCKNVFHFIYDTAGLIRKNLFLFVRLVFLVGASMVGGVALTPLLPFFNEAKRGAYWYLDLNYLIPLGTLLVSGVFICYLIIHILEKQTTLDIKRIEAKQTVRAKEKEEKEYFHYHDERPRTERLINYAKDKILRLTWKKNEDE